MNRKKAPELNLLLLLRLTTAGIKSDTCFDGQTALHMLEVQMGMNAHLSKPVEPEHLYQTLEELIWEDEENRKSG